MSNGLSKGGIRFLLAPLLFVTVAAAGNTAYADIIGVYQPSPFTGPYIGVQGGYGVTGVDIDFDIAGVQGETDDNEHGFSFGGYAGYSGVVDRLFGGVEIDGSLSTVEWNDSANGVRTTLEQDFTIGVSGLVGFLLRPNLLFYGRLGYVYTEFNAEATDGTITESDEEGFDGFRVGAGLDFAFIENLSARAEYSYTNYEDMEVTAGGDSVSFSPYEHLVRAGVAYRF